VVAMKLLQVVRGPVREVVNAHPPGLAGVGIMLHDLGEVLLKGLPVDSLLGIVSIPPGEVDLVLLEGVSV